MPTQEQHDKGFLRGFFQAVQVVAQKEALGQEGYVSQTPDALATRLQERGFHRGSSVSAVDVNRLAQFLYEESTSVGAGFELRMPMTGKADLVAALTRALQRADVAVTKEQS